MAVEELDEQQPGVFAAGDTVRGASLVVHAINQGRLCAAACHKWLVQEASPSPIVVVQASRLLCSRSRIHLIDYCCPSFFALARSASALARSPFFL